MNVFFKLRVYTYLKTNASSENKLMFAEKTGKFHEMVMGSS